jgi:UDP-glucose 4-epimerase
VTHEWLIGRGLLGGALVKRTSDELHYRSVRWGSVDTALADLRASALDLAARAATDPIRIYWTAGAGVTSTAPAKLTEEVQVFRSFLELVREIFPGRPDLFLASSVGGVYAGNPAPPFDEDSLTRPLSPYGEAKLAMEDALREHVELSGGRGLIGRLSNLYGPGQDMSKGQGLISVMARTYIDRRAASIFVPLDTIRDYIYVDDAAAIVIAGMSRLATQPSGSVIVKIVASSTGTTIASLLGEFARVRKARPLIVLGGGNAAGQASDLRVISRVWTDLDAEARTTLPAGIDSTFRALHSAWAAGNG